MSNPADASLVPLATPFDVLQSTGATDRAVFAPRACNRSRKSRSRRAPTIAVYKFASTDVPKAHPPLERKELTAGSRELPVERSQSKTGVASISIRNSCLQSEANLRLPTRPGPSQTS